MRRYLPLLLLLLLVVAGCEYNTTVVAESTTAPTTTTTTAPTTTTTTAPTTTTTTAPTTTTTTAPTTPTSTPTTTPPTTTTVAARAVASGSGCAPGDVSSLPDGDWFGFIEEMDRAFAPDGTLTVIFDLACHFDGVQADIAMAEDGVGPNEFYPYIRNRNPRVFLVTVSADTIVDDYEFETYLFFYDWLVYLRPDDGCDRGTGYRSCAVWLRIRDGVATRIYDMPPEWSGDGRGS